MYTFSGSVTPIETSLNQSKVSNAHFAGLLLKPNCFCYTMENGQTCCFPEEALITCLSYCFIDLQAMSAIRLYYYAV